VFFASLFGYIKEGSAFTCAFLLEKEEHMPDLSLIIIIFIVILALIFIIARAYLAWRFMVNGRWTEATVKNVQDSFVEAEWTNPLTNKTVFLRKPISSDEAHRHLRERYARGETIRVKIDPKHPKQRYRPTHPVRRNWRERNNAPQLAKSRQEK
jgi:hypothetical protein